MDSGSARPTAEPIVPIARQPLHEARQPMVDSSVYGHPTVTRLSETKTRPSNVSSVSDLATEFYFTRNRTLETKLHVKTTTTSLMVRILTMLQTISYIQDSMCSCT